MSSVVHSLLLLTPLIGILCLTGAGATAAQPAKLWSEDWSQGARGLHNVTAPLEVLREDDAAFLRAEFRQAEHVYFHTQSWEVPAGALISVQARYRAHGGTLAPGHLQFTAYRDTARVVQAGFAPFEPTEQWRDITVEWQLPPEANRFVVKFHSASNVLQRGDVTLDLAYLAVTAAALDPEADTTPRARQWGEFTHSPGEESVIFNRYEYLVSRATNYASADQGATAESLSPVKRPDLGPEKAIDGDIHTAWVVDDGLQTGEIVFHLPETRRINAVAWLREQPGFTDDGRAPRDYDVLVSLDGQNWTKVVEVRYHFMVSRIDTFAPVEARHIKFHVLAKQQPNPNGASLRWFGAFYLEDLEQTAWFDERWDYRLRLEARERHGPLARAPVNLSAHFSFAPDAWADLRSLLVATTRGESAAALSRECPLFLRRSGYDPRTNAAGFLYWHWPEPDDTTAWLYFNNKTHANLDYASAYDGTVSVQREPEGWRLSAPGLEAPGPATLLAEDGETVPLGAGGRVERDHLEPARYYALITPQAPVVTATWFTLPPDDPQELIYEGPSRSVVERGEVITRTFGLPAAPGAVSYEFSLSDGQETVFHTARAANGRLVTPRVPTRHLRPGLYTLAVVARGPENRLLATHRDAFILVPELDRDRVFFHGWAFPMAPAAWERLMAWNREQNLTSLVMRLHRSEMSAVARLGMDTALEHGLTVLSTEGGMMAPPEDLIREHPEMLVRFMYHPDPIPAATFPRSRGFSLSHPLVRRSSAEGFGRLAEQIDSHPASGQFMAIGDDFGPAIVSGDWAKPEGWENRWYNLDGYDETSRAQFKLMTGHDLPRFLETPMPAEGVVPDNDPWLQFLIYRARDYYGGYNSEIVREIRRRAPRVQTASDRGHMQVPFFAPTSGYYPPAEQAFDIVSSYFYPGMWVPSFDYVTQYEIGRIGNRDKDVRLLTGNFADPGELGENYWMASGHLWNMISAGMKDFGWFAYTPPMLDNQPWSAFLRTWGERLHNLSPVILSMQPVGDRPVAVLLSFTDGALGDTQGAWRWKAGGGALDVFRQLARDNFPVEFVGEEEILEGRLDRYQALVVANTRYLRRSAYEAVRGWVAEGGRLYCDAPSAVIFPELGVTPVEPAQLREELARLIDRPVICEPVDATCRRLQAAGADYLVLVNNYTDRWAKGQSTLTLLGDPAAMDEIRERGLQPQPVTADLSLASPRPLFLYDLSRSRRLPAEWDAQAGLVTARLELESHAGGAFLWVSPVEVGEFAAEVENAAQRGRDLRLRFSLRGQGGLALPGVLPVRWSLHYPDGSPVLSERVLGLERGVATLTVPLAVNAPPGTYRLRARELATGQELEQEIPVR